MTGIAAFASSIGAVSETRNVRSQPSSVASVTGSVSSQNALLTSTSSPPKAAIAGGDQPCRDVGIGQVLGDRLNGNAPGATGRRTPQGAGLRRAVSSRRAPFVREALGDCAADPARGACDQRGPAFEPPSIGHRDPPSVSGRHRTGGLVENGLARCGVSANHVHVEFHAQARPVGYANEPVLDERLRRRR